MTGRLVLSLLVSLVYAGSGFAQSVAPGYTVGTWRGFRTAAVSHTFDDNDRNQLAVAVPMFDAFGFKLTLFALTDVSSSWRPPDWPGLVAAAGRGHEVASHTVTHPRLNELSAERQASELKRSYDAIREHIPGRGALTLAYPYCVPGNAPLARPYYFAARGCQGNVERSTPADLMNISSIIAGTEGTVKTAANFISRARAALGTNGWTVFLIHGIDNDGGYSPIPSKEMQTYLEYLKAHEDEFWVETFGNVARYLRERNAASVSERAATADALTVQLSDTLDDATYHYPLTLRRELPAGWTTAAVTQAGAAVPARTVVEGAKRYIQFDAVPDGGDVVLTRSTGTGTETGAALPPAAPLHVEVYPNPFGASTTLAYDVEQTGWVRLDVYNLLGERVATLVDRAAPAGRHTVRWDAAGLSAGPYLYRYEAGGRAATGLLTRTR